MEISEVSTSVVKWSKGLSNRISIIIRGYIDEMKFASYMAAFFITFVIVYCLTEPSPTTNQTL
jgi:hypothetical protein